MQHFDSKKCFVYVIENAYIRCILVKMPAMDILQRFIHYIGAEQNLSPNTVAAYRRDLEAWRDYATSGGRREFVPDDMSPTDLRVWLADCRRQGCSTLTLRRKLQSLRAFYRYMMRYEGLPSSPAAELQAARVAHPLPVQVKEAETHAMLDAMEADTAVCDAGFEAVRNALIVEMLYDTGLRCQELIDLKDAGVDTVNGIMRVMGKRAKERLVPIAPHLAQAIVKYRSVRAEETGITVTGPFFVRSNGMALYRRLVYSIVHNAMAGAGVHASRLSPHVLRHSCATDMLNHGADLNTVRELLGHASLATTQIYTHLTYRDLQQNYQQAHPRAQKNKDHGS